MKNLMISAALGALLIGGGVAIAQSSADGHGPGMRRGAMLMKMLDANGDGTITKAELTSALDQRFAKMDLDHDGKITAQERQALRKQRVDARFDHMDTDRNGQVSKAEFEAAAAARMERGQKMRMEGGGQDRPGMGDHRMGGHPMGDGMRGGWGMRPDADGDGVLTKAEFMARPLAMFDRVDANHDGKVTADEIAAIRTQMGMRHRGMMNRMHGGGMAPDGAATPPAPPQQ